MLSSTGKLKAINRAQAMVEYSLDGYLLTANENFLDAVGYSLEEIRGKHHKYLCGSEYTSSEEYKTLWKQLRDGEVYSGRFKKIASSNKDVWFSVIDKSHPRL